MIVTPLDVVRVRWQSQNVPQPATNLPKPDIASPNAFRPSNLGVTACCREVFFMNNNSAVCMAGPRIGSLGNPGDAMSIPTSLGGGGSGSLPADCAIEQTQQRTFNSTLDGMRKIARNEGVPALWRGLSPTLLMAIPANIIYFTGYEWLRSDPRSPVPRVVRDAYAPLAAGASARILAAAAVGPIELFRTRLQASSSSSSSSARGHLADTFRGLSDMVRLHGYRSLWRGLTLTLWRDVPFSGMYWWGYESVRAKLTDARESRRGRTLDLDGASAGPTGGRARRRSQSRGGSHQETFTDSFIAGALSGAFASVATMPFDVGKTRTQVHRDTRRGPGGGVISAVSGGGGTDVGKLAPEEQPMVRLLWHIFRAEGFSGLFRGWIPRTLKVAPACAIMISSYEVGKRAFRGVNERALPVSRSGSDDVDRGSGTVGRK